MKKTYVFLILFNICLLNCNAQQNFSSSYTYAQMYYKDDIEKITFTIPKEKAVEGTAKLLFLDKNNNETVCYEMPVQIKNNKCKYVLKKIPSGRIGGITRELYEEYYGSEYEWLIHLKIIFEDGSEYIYEDNYLCIGAMFDDENIGYTGNYNFEIRGKIKIEEDDFSFILPAGYKEFTALRNKLFPAQKNFAKVYSTVDYSYWAGFSFEKPFKEFFSIGSFQLIEFSTYYDTWTDFLIAFGDFLKETHSVKKSDVIKVKTANGLEGVKETVKTGSNSFREVYLFPCKDKILYIAIDRKIKDSELEKIIPSILETLEEQTIEYQRDTLEAKLIDKR